MRRVQQGIISELIYWKAERSIEEETKGGILGMSSDRRL